MNQIIPGCKMVKAKADEEDVQECYPIALLMPKTDEEDVLGVTPQHSLYLTKTDKDQLG